MDQKTVDVFHKIVGIWERYRAVNYGPGTNILPINSTEASAFNILCVIFKIRKACLIQCAEDQSEEQLPTTTQKLEAAVKLVRQEFIDFLPEEWNVVPHLYRGDLFFIHWDYYDRFLHLPPDRKTDILNLCSQFGKNKPPNPVFFRFAFRTHSFYTNVCHEEEGLNSIAKHLVMYEQMKELANSIGLKDSVFLSIECGRQKWQEE